MTRGLATRKRDSDFIDLLTKGLIGFDNAWFPTPEETNYPRYNIVQTEEGYILELSVVGMSKEDVQVKFKSGTLQIKGSHTEERKDAAYVHKGISTKSFERSFTIDSGLSVDDIKLENGLLTIKLKRDLEDEHLLEIK